MTWDHRFSIVHAIEAIRTICKANDKSCRPHRRFPSADINYVPPFRLHLNNCKSRRCYRSVFPKKRPSLRKDLLRGRIKIVNWLLSCLFAYIGALQNFDYLNINSFWIRDLKAK